MTNSQFKALIGKLSNITNTTSHILDRLSRMEDELVRLKAAAAPREQWGIRAEWISEEDDDDVAQEVRWYGGTMTKGGVTFPVWTEDMSDADFNFPTEEAAREMGKLLKHPTDKPESFGEWDLYLYRKAAAGNGIDASTKKLVHLPQKKR